MSIASTTFALACFSISNNSILFCLLHVAWLPLVAVGSKNNRQWLLHSRQSPRHRNNDCLLSMDLIHQSTFRRADFLESFFTWWKGWKKTTVRTSTSTLHWIVVEQFLLVLWRNCQTILDIRYYSSFGEIALDINSSLTSRILFFIICFCVFVASSRKSDGSCDGSFNLGRSSARFTKWIQLNCASLPQKIAILSTYVMSFLPAIWDLLHSSRVSFINTTLSWRVSLRGCFVKIVRVSTPSTVDI